MRYEYQYVLHQVPANDVSIYKMKHLSGYLKQVGFVSVVYGLYF